MSASFTLGARQAAAAALTLNGHGILRREAYATDGRARMMASFLALRTGCWVPLAEPTS